MGECMPTSWKLLIASSNDDDDAGDVRVRCRVAMMAVWRCPWDESFTASERDRTTPEEERVGWTDVAKAARQVE